MKKQLLLSTLREEVLSNLPNHPYHNRAHTEAVMMRMRLIASHTAPFIGKDAAELLEIAALFHDYDHAGRTLRQTVVDTDQSNEERSVEFMRERLASYLTESEIERIAGAILATAFGQDDESRPYYRSYPADTTEKKLLAFADIASFATMEYDEWTEESLQVLAEFDPDSLPESYEAWQKGRKGFVGYLRMRLAEVTPLLSTGFVASLTLKLGTIEDLLTSPAANEKFVSRFDRVRSTLLQS